MKWNKNWKRSKKPTKQRLYLLRSPKHLAKKLLSVHLSKELIKKYSIRNVSIRKGDKVKILRGQHKGKSGKVERVDRKMLKVYVEGIEQIRKDGTKSPIALNPSNLMITELYLEDRKRKEKLEKAQTIQPKEEKVKTKKEEKEGVKENK